jgi:hypothetical protein
MEIIIGILLVFYLFLLEKVLEMKDRIKDLEKIAKSINQDLNMISKTMENNQKTESKKQILKG